MNPGLLKNRIQVKKRSKTPDGYGGYTANVITDLTIWGDVKYTSGEFKMENGARSKYNGVEVIVRKKAFDEIDDIDFQFSIDGVKTSYRVNDVYEMIKNEYVKIIATDI